MSKLIRINRKLVKKTAAKKLRVGERKLAAKNKWIRAKKRLHGNNYSYSPGTRTNANNPMWGLD
tara:strand:- start:56 stop:247 length:192 start_codon:yes stop_codon:yes gene_type:complete